MKHNIYEFSLFLKILCFESKGEYRCLLIGRVQYLYTIEHAVENIAYQWFQSIPGTLLFLLQANFFYWILYRTCELTPGGGNVMCVCLYQKSVCK